jgi:soluble lytic murein transglycosylase-like protein
MKDARTAIAIGIAGGALVWLATRGVSVPFAEDTPGGVRALAISVSGRFFAQDVDPVMATAIARIESNFNPTAVRFEPGVVDFSVGLMQTLVGTARWLADTLGYASFGVPTFDALFDAETSMYFGMAYLHYLSTRNGITRGEREEVIVRAYNTGPGNWASSAGAAYWVKYQAARAEIG